MAKHLIGFGIATTVITGAVDKGDSKARVVTESDGASCKTRFVHLPRMAYSGNGAGRVVSMLVFSCRVLAYGLPSRRLGRPDVVMGSSPDLFTATSAWLLAKRYRVPFILEVRDLWPRSLVALLGVGPRHPLVIVLAAIEKHLYLRSDAIIGLLPGVAQHVRTVTGRAAPVTWVPNGIDPDLLPVVTEPPTNTHFTVAYAGAHGVPNALDVAIEAASRLADKKTSHGGDFRFLFVGDGVLKADLKRSAKALGLSNVEFLSHVPKAQVYGVLAGADALMVTARRTDLYSSGMSLNKLFDYFAVARPVIMGLETPFDPVRDARAGLSITAESATALEGAVIELDRLSRRERAEMGLRGRAFVETHHLMDHLAGRVAALVQRLGH